jgi:uncharacterized protein (TIGR02246 family)
MSAYAAAMRRFMLILVFLAAACATTTPVSRPGEEAAVRAAMNGFMDALNALDAERMSAYFADDITGFVPLAQADRVEGREAMTRIFRNFVARTKPMTPRLNIIPEDMEVLVSGDLGVVSFNVREKSPDVTRRRTFVFVRHGDRWLIRHAHATDFAGSPR